VKRRRRCCVCGKLFSPDPRVGARQRTCGGKECRIERHREACREWRERERAATPAERFRKRLGTPDLRREIVRDELGAKVEVALEECLRLIEAGARDAFQTKTLEITRKYFRLVKRDQRDATAHAGPAP
jgi:hypothetical protein